MDKYEYRRQQLLRLKEKKCDGVIAKLAKRIGKEPSYVSRLLYPEGKAGKKRIADDLIEAIEKAFPGWLNLVDDRESASNLLPGPPLRGRVPVISWASAGQWEEIVDNSQPGQADDWIDTDAPIKRHTFALTVKGDSMEPDFPNGSCIIVEPESQAENGDYVVVRQNGSEATFKQLVKDGSRVYLKPINPRYPILEMALDAEICGVVVEVVNRRRLK